MKLKGYKAELTLLSSIDERPLKPPEMMVAVMLEKQRRNAKGHAFHCIVTDINEKASIWYPADKNHSKGRIVTKEGTQLNYTLMMLHKDFLNGQLRDGARVQLLVHNGTHWTAVDIEFKGNKEEDVSFLIIDAAGDSRWEYVKTAIEKHFPQATTFICQGGIQTDHENCSSFSLHHAFQSSKIEDLFSYLDGKKEIFEKQGGNNFTLTMFQLPPQLVMTTQGSKRLLESYFEMHPHLTNYMIKNLSFFNFINSNTKTYQVPNTQREKDFNAPTYRSSLRNDFIFSYRKKQKDKIKTFVASASENELFKMVGLHIQSAMNDLHKNKLTSYKKHQAIPIMSSLKPTDSDQSFLKTEKKSTSVTFFSVKPEPFSKESSKESQEQNLDNKSYVSIETQTKK